MKKRKAKIKPDKFELWLKARIVGCLDPVCGDIAKAYAACLSVTLDEYRKFKRRKK